MLLAPLLILRSAGADTPDPFAWPPELDRDVRFWIRVYTEVSTDQGLLHDDWNLGRVYEVLRFDPAMSPAQRERRVVQAKARYAALLRRFAAGNTDNLTAQEADILHSFGAAPTAQQLFEAIERIRFQLGQANRFREGLIRAAVWEPHIASVLSRRGVPAQIAALPHVESSFNPGAYSKVGAAGLWQFMPSTARRFMRVDSLIDERLDPYSATEAAANLLLYNYRLLGSWPLAVTAYNHGPGGLRRAQEELGTRDIAVIVKRYRGATFGFASRNFYVAFLAALEVDRNAQNYFGPITHLPDTESTPVEVPDYVAVEALAKAFKVDLGALRVLNPALRPPIWSGSRFVPRGYTLRLPGIAAQSEIAAAWTRLPQAQRFAAQRTDGSPRNRRVEAVAGVAPARARRTPPAAEPVSERQAVSAALLPAATPVGGVDTTDYEVGAHATVTVQAEETLGHFADWSGVGAHRLRTLNGLRKDARVTLGHKIKLDLSLVTAAQFATARRDYHRHLQEAYFAAHRIAGTENYRVKRGESLWMIAQQRADLPVWLVTQYNPDVDFNDIRPGTTITVPRVVSINRQ